MNIYVHSIEQMVVQVPRHQRHFSNQYKVIIIQEVLRAKHQHYYCVNIFILNNLSVVHRYNQEKKLKADIQYRR